MSKPGKLLVGNHSAVVLFDRPGQPHDWDNRVDFHWHGVDCIYTTGGRYPSVMVRIPGYKPGTELSCFFNLIPSYE